MRRQADRGVALRHLLQHLRTAEVRRGGIALADQVVASATSFVVGIIIARRTSQDEFGLYMLGASLVLLAMRLQVALIATPFMVFSPRLERRERARFVGSTLVQQLGIAGLAAGLLALAGMLVSTGVGPQGFERVAWALTFAVIFILLREYARHVSFADLQFGAALAIDLWFALIVIGGLIVLADRTVLSAASAFWVIGTGCGVAAGVWLYRVRDSVAFSWAGVRSDSRRNWEFGKWIFASGVLWEVVLVAYPWLLAILHGTAAAGEWAACFGAFAIGNPVLLGMQNFIGPRISHGFASRGVEGLKKTIRESALAFSLLVLPIALILLIFGDFVVVSLYGEAYRGHGLVVALLAIELLVSPARFALSRALFTVNRAAADFWTNCLPIVFFIVAGIWLVRIAGPVGVAVGISAGGLLSTLAKFIAFRTWAKYTATEHGDG